VYGIEVLTIEEFEGLRRPKDQTKIYRNAELDIKILPKVKSR